MKKRKKPYFVDKEHRLYIIRNKCLFARVNDFCKQYDDVDEYGEGVVTPAHITARGMGGKNHGLKYEYDNLLPLCSACHSWFDTKLGKDEKEKFRKFAIILTEMYKSEKDLK